MSPPRVDHKIYSRGPSAQSAWRVYEYTGQWPHELVKGFEPASWAETFSREFARLLGIAREARNVEIKDVLQQLKSRAAERQAPRNCLTRPDISQVREWLRDEKGVTATRCKMVRRPREESDDESEKGSEAEAEPESAGPKSEEEEEAESEGDSGSDPEPLPEINVHDSDDSTSDSSSDDDEMEIDEPTPSATTTTRFRNGQSTSKQSKQPFPTPSLTPEAARKLFFDGLDEHYRRAVRRAAMAKKPQPQPKPQLLFTPPASGDSAPPNNKDDDDRASITSTLSDPPDEPWPKRLRTRAENVSSPDRHGQLESPLRRESATTIPDSNVESDENSRDTAPASSPSSASVSSNCDKYLPSTAPATAAPPAIKPSTVAPTTTTHAPTPSNENISSASIDSTSATGRPRRNIQLPSRIAHSKPQSAVAIVEKSRKRPREPTVETREHPMSLESSPESEEDSASVMGSIARNDSLRAASSAKAVPVQAAPSSSQTGRNATSRMSIASLLQATVQNVGSESPSPATLGRDGESSNPPQSNSPPTTVSPPAKKQKVADMRSTGTSFDVDTTQPTEESSDEDLPDWDALIADWDAKAARVASVLTNIQENRTVLSEKSKYVEFLEHMHRTHPPDEDGRKHYEDEKKKLGEYQFLHGLFLKGFEEAKRAAVANADPDVTLAEQARRMGASKRKRGGLIH